MNDAKDDSQEINTYIPSISSGIFGSYFFVGNENSFCKHGLIISGEFHCYIHPNKSPQTIKNSTHMSSGNTHLKIIKLYTAFGSVVDFDGEAIVNAADEYMMGGDGVDGAIMHAGGSKLAEYRKKIPFVSDGVRCPVGEARITPSAGTLKCKHIVHTVGPDYSKMYKFAKYNYDKTKSIASLQQLQNNQTYFSNTSINTKFKNKSNMSQINEKAAYAFGIDKNNYKGSGLLKRDINKQLLTDVLEKGDILLENAYKSTMELCKQEKIQSVAFSLISAGIYKGQQNIDKVLSIGLKTIYNNVYYDLDEIYMVGFTAFELKTLNKLLLEKIKCLNLFGIWGKPNKLYYVAQDKLTR